MNVAQNGNDSPAAPSVLMKDASHFSSLFADLFRAKPNEAVQVSMNSESNNNSAEGIVTRDVTAAANDVHNHGDDIEWVIKPQQRTKWFR